MTLPCAFFHSSIFLWSPDNNTPGTFHLTPFLGEKISGRVYCAYSKNPPVFEILSFNNCGFPKTPGINLEIDSIAHCVKINKEEVFFPKKEFQLLHFLLSNRGKVLSREVLLNQIWGENVYVVDRTIDVHGAKVREKLGEYSEYIETIKGLGYRFNND